MTKASFLKLLPSTGSTQGHCQLPSGHGRVQGPHRRGGQHGVSAGVLATSFRNPE